MKTLSKKILMISTETSDVFISDLGLKLVDKGHEVWRFFVLDGVLLEYNSGDSYKLHKPSSSKDILGVFKATTEVRKKLQKVDVIHLHFITSILYVVILGLGRMGSPKRCASIWGSDYYKISSLRKYLNYFICYYSDAISLANNETLKVFTSFFPSLAHKTEHIAFGLNTLDLIDSLKKKEERSESLKKLEIKGFNKVVCLGTNASLYQNHILIIESLQKLSQNTKNALCFLIPLAYPRIKPEYLKEIKDALAKAEIENYILILDFAIGEELVRRRIVTDILIQLQTTDQFSGAMQEVFYAGGYVITGNWLPYQMLKEKGAHYVVIDDFVELPRALEKAVEYGLSGGEAKNNKLIIHDLSSWNNLITLWEEFYR